MTTIAKLISTLLLLLITTLAEAEPTPQAAEISSTVQQLIEEQRIAGAIVLVEHKGQVVHFSAHGMRDIEEKDLLDRDDILRIYSMTKPIVSVATLMLVEDGKLSLQDPIAKHMPEFSALTVQQTWRKVKPTRPPTVHDLLTHTAGFTYGFFSNTSIDKAYNKDHPLFSKNNQEMVDKLSQHPLLFHPGKKWHYSVATDVLGHLVERVSGQALGEFLEQRIFRPLNMKDTAFYIAPDKLSRFASSYTPELTLKERYNKSWFQLPQRIQSGGGGLVSTAQDYLQFSRMLLNNGELNGTRLLSESAVHTMTSNQLPEGVRAYGLFGFGYGVQVQLDNWGPKGHIGEYGWNGAASTHFWISPADQLIVIALSQRQPYSNQLKKALKPVIYKSIAP